MPADPQQVKALFLDCLDRPPAERAAALVAAPAGVRAAVERLLAAHDQPDHRLDPPAVGFAGQVLAGRYTLLAPLGEGGMGAVWRAEQTAPVRREVAVKLVKPGMDSRAVLARFEAERQALAVMDHPNIAKVFDAGTTPAGRPFFVMELVAGPPVTAYCDARRLTPRDRLELFVPVCQAVQHAHQKGVIHRDLKPSNVLVAEVDGRPVPKVIDFGVAKAVGGPLTGHTVETGLGVVVGTPEYMSPEQASLDNPDVDTRSDVYSLGVLLYELLAGSPPFARRELAHAGVLEMLRMVREQKPPRPSAKLGTSAALPGVSASRGMEPRKLTGVLRAELDWLVLKALEKDRERRYETPNGLAADVLRYLGGEPVLAVPPSARYRLRKWARRHRRALTVGGSVAGILFGAASVAVWSLERADRVDKQATVLDAQTAIVAARVEAVKQREAEAEAAVRSRAETWPADLYRHLAGRTEGLFQAAARSKQPAFLNELQAAARNDRMEVYVGFTGLKFALDGTGATGPNPAARRYAATVAWGYGKGLMAVGDYPGAADKLDQAAKYAADGFGPADDLTLEIAADRVSALHLAGRDAAAWGVVRAGHAAARDALRADPRLADYKPSRHLARSWEDLLAVGVLLPADDGPSADALWDESAALLVASREWHRQPPQRDYFYTVTERRAVRPRDKETALRKRLANLDAEAKPASTDYAVWLAFELAGLILDARDGREAEAEQLLLRVYRATVVQLPPSGPNVYALPEQRRELLRDTLDKLTRLYTAWGKPAQAAEKRAERFRLFPEVAPRPQPAR